MEYELHCQLQNKLKVKGMNALFGLKVQVVVGERMLVALGVSIQTLFKVCRMKQSFFSLFFRPRFHHMKQNLLYYQEHSVY